MPLLGEPMDALNHVVIGKVYEWMITLDMEMRLVWRCKWSFMKGVYLLNRYLVIVDFVLNCFRSYSEHVPALIYVIGLFLSEYTLAVRVCVVWKMNRIVIVSLASVCVTGFTWALTSFFIMLHSIE
ncbi:hypothetical protein P691DRAFT_780893, partial [Macrolepiota fuliginosa MF-IS2]